MSMSKDIATRATRKMKGLKDQSRLGAKEGATQPTTPHLQATATQSAGPTTQATLASSTTKEGVNTANEIEHLSNLSQVGERGTNDTEGEEPIRETSKDNGEDEVIEGQLTKGCRPDRLPETATTYRNILSSSEDLVPMLVLKFTSQNLVDHECYTQFQSISMGFTNFGLLCSHDSNRNSRLEDPKC
ncbi:hypothetical protein PGT21_024992 [Puccinia graminis f. sp. tritici]|uniref:Uncharacterized protein n=1 Tax=Puccinia graminis f. sp. tritici TaxID=56615 RepID=A0A5B0M5A7_PUCGR|nr:hypothetical protein PGT21_024992 [Puccinia graminis f. sp. tritici]